MFGQCPTNNNESTSKILSKLLPSILFYGPVEKKYHLTISPRQALPPVMHTTYKLFLFLMRKKKNPKSSHEVSTPTSLARFSLKDCKKLNEVWNLKINYLVTKIWLSCWCLSAAFVSPFGYSLQSISIHSLSLVLLFNFTEEGRAGSCLFWVLHSLA